jgi:predicted metal-dependent hydrolase
MSKPRVTETTIEAGGLRARLLRSRRRSVSLQIQTDLSLLMRAPIGASEASLRVFLEHRRHWVDKHRSRMERLRAADPLPSWTDGDSIPYLGGRLRLEVLKARGSRSTATLEGESIRVSAVDPEDREAVRRSVERLFAREAAELFPKLLDGCLAQAQARRLPRPELRLRSMKARWGSCDTVRKIVTLNTRLLRQSVEVIEYVIFHELAHLRHRSHDARFKAFLAELCPEWRERQAKLSDLILD